MFKLNEDFLEGMGVENESAEVKEQLLAGAEKMIRDRVLLKLSDQITDFLADELAGINESSAGAENWLAKNAPYYTGSEDYKAFEKDFAENAPQIFAQTKWFQMNLPTYAEEIKIASDQVRNEMLAVVNKQRKIKVCNKGD